MLSESPTSRMAVTALTCQQHMLKCGVQLEDWKTPETAGEEMISEAEGQKETALAHYQLGVVLFDEGQAKNKQEIFGRLVGPENVRSQRACGENRRRSSRN
jgi:hypothetical protein